MSSTTEPSILYTLAEDGVALLTLNRPHKRNAFDAEMLALWLEHINEFAANPSAKVLVLTGAGSAFCAGGDVGSMAERASQNALQRKEYLSRNVHTLQLATSRLDKPVIAAINGSARGAGLDMALVCDIRFMSSSATLAESYIDLGLVAGNGGAYLLPRLVGIERALELLWTGRVVEAAEAERIGLVLRVVPDDRLLDEALELARRIAKKPAEAVRMFKRVVYQSLDLPFATHLDMVSSHMSVLRDSEEHRQRVVAVANSKKS